MAGKAVKFTVRASSPGRRRYDIATFERSTDAAGLARLSLPQYETCVDVHRHYFVHAEFAPAAGDAQYAAAVSAKFHCYRMTSTAGRRNTYDFYAAGRQLFVMPEILTAFPEIRRAVEAFGSKPNFTAKEFSEALEVSSSRGNELLNLFARHNVLLRGSGGAYSWNEIEPNRVLPVTVFDDFTKG